MTTARTRLNWTAFLFTAPSQVVGMLAWPAYLLLGGGIHWQEIAAFLFMYVFSVIGIGVGYHRGWSHRAFAMSTPMKILMLLAGSSAAEGSVLVWCADHRKHHQHEDTEHDPHNIHKGFWWAHMGWLFRTQINTDFSKCQDLMKDPWLRNQHEHYVAWLTACCFGIPLLIGLVLGRPLAVFLLAGLMRLFLMNQVTFLINSYAHYFGRKTYSESITARDSHLLGLISGGEGYHNFHHRFPSDYRNGHKFYHLDFNKITIYLSSKLGLTSNLKKVPETQIWKARREADLERLKNKSPEVTALASALDRALAAWQDYSERWNTLRKNTQNRRDEAVKSLQKQMKLARRDFLSLYRRWRGLLQS